MMSVRAFPLPQALGTILTGPSSELMCQQSQRLDLPFPGLACSDVIPEVQGTPICLTSSLIIMYTTSLAKPGNRASGGDAIFQPRENHVYHHSTPRAFRSCLFWVSWHAILPFPNHSSSIQYLASLLGLVKHNLASGEHPMLGTGALTPIACP